MLPVVERLPRAELTHVLVDFEAKGKPITE
jgi:hypothetical protein